MKNILVLVATGFEDTELITSLNEFNRSEVSYDLVSVENKEQVKGQNDALVNTKKIDDIEDLKDYELLFLPGGMGHKILLEDNKTIELVKEYFNEKKWLAAICAAPEVLKKADVLFDVKYTSYPGFATSENNSGEEVEVDRRIITGRDYKATHKFAEAVIKKIKS